jgi:hypothetical protein
MPKTAAKTHRSPRTPSKPATGSPAPSLPTGKMEIAGLRYEVWSAGKLLERANPDNWRIHPPEQIKALRATIDKVGIAGAALLNETTGNLIDGHARVSSSPPDQLWPVLVGRWTLEQERQILVSLDPLAAMAQADAEKLAELTADMDLEGDLAGLAEQLDKLQAEDAPGNAPRNGSGNGPGEDAGAGDPGGGGGLPAADAFRVVVECRDEEHQERVRDLLLRAGEQPRLMTIHA